jgi:hypothetical protein
MQIVVSGIENLLVTTVFKKKFKLKKNLKKTSFHSYLFDN